MIPLDVPIEVGREEGRRLAAELLQEARYDLELPTWLIDLLRRLSDVLQRLVERIAELVERFVVLPTGGGGSGDGANGWLPIGIVVLLLGLGVLIWRVGIPQLNRRRQEVSVATDTAVSPAAYRTLAEQAAERGDLTTAVLEEFRALVRELEHLTVIDPRPSRTASEVAWRSSLVVPAAGEDLRAAAEQFNEVMYGHRRPTLEHWQRLRVLAEQIVTIAGRADLSAVPM